MRRVLASAAVGVVLVLSAWVGKEVEGAPTPYTTTTRCEQVGGGGLTTCVDESGTFRTTGGTGDDAIGLMYLPAGTPTLPCPADDAPWTTCVLNQAGILVRADVEPGRG
jgi:hypothetical protein